MFNFLFILIFALILFFAALAAFARVFGFYFKKFMQSIIDGHELRPVTGFRHWGLSEPFFEGRDRELRSLGFSLAAQFEDQTALRYWTRGVVFLYLSADSLTVAELAQVRLAIPRLKLPLTPGEKVVVFRTAFTDGSVLSTTTRPYSAVERPDHMIMKKVSPEANPAEIYQRHLKEIQDRISEANASPVQISGGAVVEQYLKLDLELARFHLSRSNCCCAISLPEQNSGEAAASDGGKVLLGEEEKKRFAMYDGEVRPLPGRTVALEPSVLTITEKRSLYLFQTIIFGVFACVVTACALSKLIQTPWHLINPLFWIGAVVVGVLLSVFFYHLQAAVFRPQFRLDKTADELSLQGKRKAALSEIVEIMISVGCPSDRPFTLAPLQVLAVTRTSRHTLASTMSGATAKEIGSIVGSFLEKPVYTQLTAPGRGRTTPNDGCR